MICATMFASSHPKTSVAREANTLEDRISQLPDEILVSILSRLTVIEAVSASLLSRIWSYLWTYIPVLNFDDSKRLHDLKLGCKSLKKEAHKYVSFVNQVLNSYQGPSIELFRVHFLLGASSAKDIDKWINFAIEKRVQRLELDLSDYMGGGRNKCYTFPRMSVRKLQSDIHVTLSLFPNLIP
ncbi:unnamed protein product [Ilex paraguariensis]|uniref:F-box domain-containing protein n=1 Tax=Ilex paraguariensis TaxID=185542 RepID=A0ABC8RER1_9AQUA